MILYQSSLPFECFKSFECCSVIIEGANWSYKASEVFKHLVAYNIVSYLTIADTKANPSSLIYSIIFGLSLLLNEEAIGLVELSVENDFFHTMIVSEFVTKMKHNYNRYRI